MPDLAALRALLERLASATGPDRSLDLELWLLAQPPDVPVAVAHQDTHGNVEVLAPRLTASIDEALALIQRILPDISGAIEWRDGEIAAGGFVELEGSGTIYGTSYGDDPPGQPRP